MKTQYVTITEEEMTNLAHQYALGNRGIETSDLFDPKAADTDCLVFQTPWKKTTIKIVDGIHSFPVVDGSINDCYNLVSYDIKETVRYFTAGLMRPCFLITKVRTNEYNNTIVALTRDGAMRALKELGSDYTLECSDSFDTRSWFEYNENAKPKRIEKFLDDIYNNTMLEEFHVALGDLCADKKVFVREHFSPNKLIAGSALKMPATFAEEYAYQREMVNAILEKAFITPKKSRILTTDVDLSGKSNVIYSDK